MPRQQRWLYLGEARLQVEQDTQSLKSKYPTCSARFLSATLTGSKVTSGRTLQMQTDKG